MARASRSGSTRGAALFEIDFPGAMSWRHWDSLANHTESRSRRLLVLRMIATLGNYDYVFDWVFQQNGAIRVRVGSTGIDQGPKGGDTARLE
ncbi:MAG: hypothetical protein CM1200mP2_54830 [Planctomycetaceae bacterium]|nr:MAG: hypothetical protein CM1200mP2_54830 [Planctomycetaceae bacterium]